VQARIVGLRAALLATALAAALSGCAQERNKETTGTLVGAAVGALAGSAIDNDGSGGAAAITLGAIAGAAIGNSIGRQLDEADRLKMYRAQQAALETSPSYQASEWHNPDTGNHGSITPRPAYRNQQGQYCREYQQDVIVAGKREQAYGTACRQADGSWKIIS